MAVEYRSWVERVVAARTQRSVGAGEIGGGLTTKPNQWIAEGPKSTKGKGKAKEGKGRGRGRGRDKGGGRDDDDDGEGEEGSRGANSKIPTSCARDLKYPRYPPAGPIIYTYHTLTLTLSHSHTLTHTHTPHTLSSPPSIFCSLPWPPALHSSHLTHPLSVTQLFGCPLLLDTRHPTPSRQSSRQQTTVNRQPLD